MSFKCTIFLHLFIASKTSLNLGHVSMCQEKRQIWKQPWCTRGDLLGAYRGRLYTNGVIRETWAPKEFCEAGSISWFFPLQSSVIFARLLYLALWRQNMAHLILVQLSSLNQNQKVIKNWKLAWEAFILILKPETRLWKWYCEHWFLIFLFRDMGCFLGKCSFEAAGRRTIFCSSCGRVLLYDQAMLLLQRRLLITYLMLPSP